MKTSFPIKNLFIGPVVLLFIITGVIYFNNGSWKLILLSVTFIEIGFFAFIYLFDYQFSVKIFEVTSTSFIIHYPFNFFLKDKVYNLDDIEKLIFDYPSGAKRLPFLLINLKNSKKAKRYSFFADTDSIEDLIEHLQKIGLTIEYIPSWSR